MHIPESVEIEYGSENNACVSYNSSGAVINVTERVNESAIPT